MDAVNDTGFAEFTSGLLGGVLDAIVGAQFDHARKQAELLRAVALDDAAFAKAWIGDAQVQAALQHDPAADPQALRLALAREQRALLQTVVDRGLPRIAVDHGRVSARLLFSVDRGGVPATALPGVPRGPRLLAMPVHARSPEFLRLQTDITSEVEITFKTVSD